MPEGFIPAHGNYRKLLSYGKSEIIFDATVVFCRRFLSKGDRTIDQMVQAARSGKQNIIEGTMASAASKETEIRLLSVARASLEELLADYHDFLRTRDLKLWEKEGKEALYARKLGHGENGHSDSYETYRIFVENRPAEVVANLLICLIHQANYLLDRQIRRLEKDFTAQGGLRERMTRARLDARARQTKGES